jgi:dihydroflavonol-4-reductase
MTDKGLVVVTGASGFVGKWVVVELLKAGYRVRGTVRSEAKAGEMRQTITAVLGVEPASRLETANCDLLADAGWAEAMRGASAVMHVAAQILAEEPKDPDLVIRPALEGTRRVLRFALVAGIKRVILTSSIATVGYGHGQTVGKRVYTEEHFTQFESMRWTWAYCVGKTKAERAAWEMASATGLQLTTLHPGAILGPALDADVSISLGLVSGLLDGSTPALPRNGFVLTDVRDLAEMHVAALEAPAAIGQRYLVNGRYTPFPEVAEILRKAYPNARVTLKTVPDWLIRVMVRFNSPLRQIINDIGNEKHFDGRKGEALLGRSYRPPEEAILSAAASLIELGVVKLDETGR